MFLRESFPNDIGVGSRVTTSYDTYIETNGFFEKRNSRYTKSRMNVELPYSYRRKEDLMRIKGLHDRAKGSGNTFLFNDFTDNTHDGNKYPLPFGYSPHIDVDQDGKMLLNGRNVFFGDDDFIVYLIATPQTGQNSWIFYFDIMKIAYNINTDQEYLQKLDLVQYDKKVKDYVSNLIDFFNRNRNQSNIDYVLSFNYILEVLSGNFSGVIGAIYEGQDGFIYVDKNYFNSFLSPSSLSTLQTLFGNNVNGDNIDFSNPDLVNSFGFSFSKKVRFESDNISIVGNGIDSYSLENCRLIEVFE